VARNFYPILSSVPESIIWPVRNRLKIELLASNFSQQKIAIGIEPD
jgi:hypothetical protein